MSNDNSIDSHQGGSRRRQILDSDEEGVDETTNNQIYPFQHSFSQLNRLLGQSNLKGRGLEVAERLNWYSLRNGYTNSQANQIASLALRLARIASSEITAISSLLFSSIRPAPRELFGSSLLFILLNTLGGTTNTGLDTAHDNLTQDSSIDFDSEDDEDDSIAQEQENLPIKTSIGVKLQLDALKLLLKLYAPPSLGFCIRSVRGSDEVDKREEYERFRTINLPKSFFTPKALKMLDKCYGILFHHLEYETLRPTICHLLSLLTRRKHVRHYRIAKVLALRNKDPSDVSVTALVNTYAAFYPDMLFAESVKDKQAFIDPRIGKVHGLRYPGPSWLISVYRIWSNDRFNVGSARSDRQLAQTSLQSQQADEETSIADVLQSIAPPPTLLITDESTISPSEMTSFRELGYRIDKVEMPNQVASALGHRMTMLALLSQETSKEMGQTFKGMYEWTLGTVSDQMGLRFLSLRDPFPSSNSDNLRKANEALLEGLLEFVRIVGYCDIRMQTLLHQMLHLNTWKAFSIQEKVHVLNLIGFCVPRQSHDFQIQFLDPLKTIAGQGNDEEAKMVLDCLANLIRNCSKRDWQMILRTIEEEEEVQLDNIILSIEDDVVDTIAIIISQSVSLSSALLCKRSNKISILHACLDLHEAIFHNSMIGLHDLLLPPNFVLYYPIFSQLGGVMSLSRQLGLVHAIRQMHEDYLVAKENGKADENIALDGLYVPLALRDRRNNFFAEECSDKINDCVILLIDLVWRNNGFASVESGNTDIGLPQEFFINLSDRCANRGDELERIGSPSHSASLAILMEAYANDLVRKRGAEEPVLHGPLTPSKLKEARKRDFPVINHRDFRDSFLTWLSRYGAHGISDLLNATITRFIRGQEVDQSTILG